MLCMCVRAREHSWVLQWDTGGRQRIFEDGGVHRDLPARGGAQPHAYSRLGALQGLHQNLQAGPPSFP